MTILRQIRKDRRKEESTYLLGYGSNVTSQTGEDGIISEIFNRIGIHNKWCVEFGAWDGKKYSNTYNLINNLGWYGVLIEGSKRKHEELCETYAGNDRTYCMNEIVGFEDGVNSIETIIAKTPIPKDFDLISIDIDGNDYYVWESMKSYRPRVVVIEKNRTIPNDVVFVQDRDFEINQGCSLRALVELGKKRGYELAVVTKLNAIFVVEEAFSKLGIADNDIDSMYLPDRDAKIFQGYDGTLINVGLGKLRWAARRHKVRHKQFQVLPPRKRAFGDSIAQTVAKENETEN